MKAQFLGNLGGAHCTWQVLFIRKDEQQAIAHLAISNDPVQLLPRFVDPIAILTVDYKDQTLSTRVVVAPERTNLVLSAYVPHVEFDVFVLDSFDVESDSGDGGYRLVEFELVQDGCLTGGIETEHQDAHLFVAKDLAHRSAETRTHAEKMCGGDGGWWVGFWWWWRRT